MKRITKIVFACATILGVNTTIPVSAKQVEQEQPGNKVIDRVVSIQQAMDREPESRKTLDKLKISQWSNFPNWPNWGNWYNY